MVATIIKSKNFTTISCSIRTFGIAQRLRLSPVPSLSTSKKYSTKSNQEENKDAEGTINVEDKKNQLKSSSVPTSRISRLFHYGSLAAGVGMNAAAHGISEVAKGKSPTWKSLILSDANIDRITNKFSKMRGVALKIGQLLSFQDEKVLPKELYEILSRVQNSANHMPQRQLERVMVNELGVNWEAKFSKFEKVPMAAASIGQVHAAELPDGQRVVVKIQYPGVKESIDSDLNSLLMLLTASSLLPKGLFLDKTIANARTELKWECDYNREARALQKFEALLEDDPAFEVPHVFPEYTTDKIITMTRMEGTEIMKLSKASQDTKNFISENIMRLCLEEIATFEYMQTDPNWANFLYNDKTNKIELLDFGASRPFAKEFILKYRKLLTFAALNDRKGAYEMSVQLGYLTGLESQAMKDAHVDSVLTIGEPFRGDVNKAFDFKDQTVSDRIRGNIGLMLSERLCPPPEETYSLHRKFSGIFLLCARMGASVHCAKLFDEIFALKD
ncbi:protein kinase COQ8 [Saccharomyces eubayanus]|uniref:protein kinase COQ8 n=1 Tax=Saccharomyces eubayanus TaxID=1080349 RepID=UPI0006C735DA|nr:COQ8-like protein [Saccharomyces eubayanus]KOG99403.1 COQ8-like protein [Saccharomyces eubayanus]